MKTNKRKFFSRGLTGLIVTAMLLPNILGVASASEPEPESDVTVRVVEVKDTSSNNSGSTASESTNDSSSESTPAANENSGPVDDSVPADKSVSDTAGSTDGEDTSVSENENKSDEAAASDSQSSSEKEPSINVIAIADEAGSSEGDSNEDRADVPGSDVSDADSKDVWNDITDTKRPAASEDVTHDKGTSEDKINTPAGEEKNWDIFYDADRDVYKITFNIGSETEADTQVIDLSQALEMLGQYAATGKQELEDAIAALNKPEKGDAGEKPVMGDAGAAPVEPEAPAEFEGTKPEEPIAPKEPGKPECLDENLTDAYKDIVSSVPRDDEGEPSEDFDYAELIANRTGLNKDDPFVQETASYMYEQAMVDWVMDSWQKWESEGHTYANYFGDPDTMLYYGCGITVKWPDGTNEGTPVLKKTVFEVNKDTDEYKEYLEAKQAYETAMETYSEQLDAYNKALDAWMEEHAGEREAYEQLLAAYNTDKAAYDKKVAELTEAYNKAMAEYDAKLAEIEKKYADDQAAYDAAVKQLKEDFDRRIGADVLEPGDVKKFELFLTSDSKHTYKYTSGSFTLATPNFDQFMAGLKEMWENDPEAYELRFRMPDGRWMFDPANLGMSDIDGFDGQILPDEYVDGAKYYVTVRSKPIQDMLEAIGMDAYDRFAGSYPSYWNYDINRFLSKYEGETNEDRLNAYLLDYYNSKNGTSYTTIDELVHNNPDARAELTKTETSGNKWFKLDGKYVPVQAHTETVKYDVFYKQLFSFAFGSEADIDAVLGEKTWNPETNRWEYANDSWTDNGYENALYYYMDHQEIWQKTDAYFQALLDGGLNAEQATWTSLMMALNIDGELTGNDWQDTQWPWYSSIKLDRVDIDFNLTKKDGATGETITGSETEFQVYYIDKVKNDDGTETSVNMYCTYDEENNSYTFVTTPSTVWTKNGELNISYAMMKDIVYYLQEMTAPEGYERDTNVYIVMNEEDYNKLSDEEKAELEGTFDKFLDMSVSNDGLSVSMDFVNVKIVTPPSTPDNPPTTPGTPPSTPTPNPEPEPESEIPEEPTPLAPVPEEEEIPEEEVPLAEIPEEDVPLAEIPEEEEVEVPEEDVPLSDVPRTGDISAVWYALTLLSAAGLVFLNVQGKKRQNG